MSFIVQRMSSVSANLVMTGRKAASLCLSVWWFDSKGWNRGMSVGAALVFCGTLIYGIGVNGKTGISRVNGTAKDKTK